MWDDNIKDFHGEFIVGHFRKGFENLNLSERLHAAILGLVIVRNEFDGDPLLRGPINGLYNLSIRAFPYQLLKLIFLGDIGPNRWQLNLMVIFINSMGISVIDVQGTLVIGACSVLQ